MHTRTTLNKTKIVTVFGGSGFLGRYVVRGLAKRGFQVRVAVRRPDLAFHLQPLGDVGQIRFVQANLRYPASVAKAVEGVQCAINLTGILAESGRQKFVSVHVAGAANVAKAAKHARASLIHVSAIGADLESASAYGKSKAQGEEQVREISKSAIIFRPSIIFGMEDDFFNRFARMATYSPFLPLIGGGKTKFQPIYVGDVAEAIVRGVEGKLSAGKTYELGGSEIVTMRQCLELMQKEIGREKNFINLPWFVARAFARLTGWMPGAPITVDQVRMLETDNVVSNKAKRSKLTLDAIGITPKTLGSILPRYLVQYRPHGQFTKLDENQPI